MPKAKNGSKNERGFTLIELLTVVATISVLAGIGIAAFRTMRLTAAHGAAVQALMNARTALESSLINPDTLVPAFDYTQNFPGPITDVNGAQLFPGFQNSRQMTFTIFHDPDCLDDTCQTDYIEIFHCKADDYPSYTRYGDGLQVILEHLPGTMPCA